MKRFQYNQNKNRCKQCNSELEYEKRFNKFCSNSCSATSSNKARGARSLSTRLKQSIAQSKYLSSLSDQELKAIYQSKGKTKTKNHINNIMEADFDDLPLGSKRKRIIIEQDGKCAHCHLLEWMGKPICFELDHIDGDRKNNFRSNLEILCPNCHSNTPTWKGRKNARDNSKILEYVKIKNGTPRENRTLITR